jgi:hypothetical protein
MICSHRKFGKMPDKILHTTISRVHKSPHSSAPQLTNDQMLSLKYFLSLHNTSQQAYEDVVSDTQSDPRNKCFNLLSWYAVEKLVQELTGVTAIATEMCPDSCVAYTGPFANREDCFYCGKPHYETVTIEKPDGTQKEITQATWQCYTIPIGPMLQALYHSPEIAEKMQYCFEATKVSLAQAAAIGVHLSFVTTLMDLSTTSMSKTRKLDPMILCLCIQLMGLSFSDTRHQTVGSLSG